MNEPGTPEKVNKRPFSLGHLCLDPTQWVAPESWSLWGQRVLGLLVVLWVQWVLG